MAHPLTAQPAAIPLARKWSSKRLAMRLGSNARMRSGSFGSSRGPEPPGSVRSKRAVSFSAGMRASLECWGCVMGRGLEMGARSGGLGRTELVRDVRQLRGHSGVHAFHGLVHRAPDHLARGSPIDAPTRDGRPRGAIISIAELVDGALRLFEGDL